MAMQPTTKIPEQKDTGYIRQFDFNINPNTGRPDPAYGTRAMPVVKASEFKDKTLSGQRDIFRQENPYDSGVASLRQQPQQQIATGATGGIVALADGGMLGDFGIDQISQELKNPSPTFNSVEDLYTNILGRPSDAGGAEFWKQQFGDTIDPSEINAFTQSANVELANRTPAEQQALAPNLVGGQGNAPSFEMGGQGGGVYEQPDGSRYVYKDNQWQNEPASNTGYQYGDLTMPVMGGGMGDQPMDMVYRPGSMPEVSAQQRQQREMEMGQMAQMAGQQPMSAATTTAGAAPVNAGIQELYTSILGRAPDAGGAAYWQQQFGDTVDATERATFAQAAKPEQQVADMYRNVLGRDPDPGGLQYWTTRINAGESPSNVYNEFLASARENTELVTADQIKNATFEQATTPYTGYRSTDQVNIVDEWVRNTLGREPTAADKEQTWYKDAFNTMKTAPDAKNLYNQFIDYAKTDAAATTAQKIKAATDSLTARGITEADVLRQTGKTIAQLAASDIDFTKNLVGASQLRAPGTKAGFDFSSIRKPTTPQTNAPVGTTNPYGNATNPGDITRNADGSTTVTPNIPGRPYGGFSGMEQVRNAYTDGGGSLGYTSYAPKTIEEFNTKYNKQTGDSKAAYDYLMGKAAYPTRTTASEVSKPYAEAVLGVTPNIALKKMLWDPVTKTYKPNPDYTPISYTKDGKRVVGLSDREVKDKLSSGTTTTGATGGLLSLAGGGSAINNTAAYEQWLRTNNVSIEQVARALGISVSEAKKRYNLESDSKGGSGAVDLGGASSDGDDSNPGWTNLSNEGKAAYFALNPIEANLNALAIYGFKNTPLGKIQNFFDPKLQQQLLANLQQKPAPVDDRSTYGVIDDETGLQGQYGSGPTGLHGDKGVSFNPDGSVKGYDPNSYPAATSYDPAAAQAYADATHSEPSESQTHSEAQASYDSGHSEPSEAQARGGLNLNGKYYPPKYAQGGLLALAKGGMYNLGGYSDGGRLLRGPGDGVSDSIPAMIGKKQPARLADGEFVVPARIVSELGNGSTEAGARKLYAMMERVQRARGKTTGKNKVAANSRADKYLPA